MKNEYAVPRSPLIKESIVSFWEVSRFDEPSLKETILPKGLVQIIFSFETTPLHVNINGGTQSIPRCFVEGFHTSPLHLHLANTHIFFGVVLNPTAVKHIFNFYPSEFTNCIVDLFLVDASIYSLWQRLGEQANFDDRVSVFNAWLMARLPQFTEREKAFDQFLKTHADIQLSVCDLAKYFCYSTKQLSRKIFELTGMNTERTMLYKKYLYAVNIIHNTDLPLTEVAYPATSMISHILSRHSNR